MGRAATEPAAVRLADTRTDVAFCRRRRLPDHVVAERQLSISGTEERLERIPERAQCEAQTKPSQPAQPPDQAVRRAIARGDWRSGGSGRGPRSGARARSLGLEAPGRN